ncbi:hypothetical protein BD626DRAFT_546886 [Schizophyllum amplum]|uniref:RING-type E3 ubiquitin transferase n=1 Tax=Schizophyllum amplum TaxID=97359 RepID=A0A550CKR9_9AGAR|nr:hypothetical protein BD626DRAFT_546886 [Auriculariopsis ampla]
MDEQDTCRICSAPAEPGQPLFHPCKCSGTIRYIHQDCLSTWLAHSKKKNCDVCKHPYAFTKVYAPDMPRKLPPLLIVRRAFRSVFDAAVFCLRALMVATIWLGALPYGTVWAWRMYFNLGDATAHWIASRSRTNYTTNAGFLEQVLFPPFPVEALDEATVRARADAPFLERVIKHPLWLSLSSDIFTGQIIASFIVLTFVAIFLLREWIAQNARPATAILDEMPAPPPPAPAPPAEEEERPFARYLEIPPGGLPVQGGIMRPTPEMRGPLPWPPPEDAERNLRVAFEARLQAQRGERVDDASDSAASDAELLHKRRRELPMRELHASVHARRIRTLQGERDNRGQAERSDPFYFGEPRAPEPSAGTAPFAFGYTAYRAMEGEPQASSSSQILPRLNIPNDTAFTFTAPADAPKPMTFHPINQLTFQSSYIRPNGSPNLGQSNKGFRFDTSRPKNDMHFSFGPNTFPSVSAEPAGQSSTNFHSLWPSQEPSSLAGPGSQPEAGPSRFPGSLATTGVAGPSNWASMPSPATGTPPLLTPSRRPPLPPTTTPLRSPVLSSAGASAGIALAMYRAPEELRNGYFDDVTARPMPADAMPSMPADTEVNGHVADSDNTPGGSESKGKSPATEDGLSSEEWEDVEREQLDEYFPEQDVEDEDLQDELLREEDAHNVDAVPVEEAEIEGNVDDDVDGALEAIGMRGPLGNVLQNAMLMTFVLDTAIGLGIWVPFTVGKATALLTLDPPRLFKLLQLPMVIIRVLTDPIYETFLTYVDNVFSPSVAGEALAGSGLAPEPSFFWDAIVGQQLEEVLASFGAYVRLVAEAITQTWTRLALGDGPTERAFAICLGDSVILLSAAVYLNLLSVGNVQTATRAVRNTVRQQVIVLKVAFFIFIELVVFPLGCGLILDACTMWMFPEVNVAARTIFFLHAPVTAIFYHWVAGTMFMYTFAVILAGCRTIMRPGAMWFIKDPQDANAHPIRDILDRSTLTHLRKICLSGIMYVVVVGLSVGSLWILLSLGGHSFLPLRWKTREPLSNVPVDLVFLHVALPYTMRYFRPRRYPDEERSPASYSKHMTTYLISLWNRQPLDHSQYVTDGSFRRVPSHDHVPIPPEMRATAARAKRQLQDEFTIVYLPPLFRWRVILFIVSLWVIGSVWAGVAFAVPLQLGRLFFRLWVPQDVHDGYSFLAGFYLLWACMHIIRAVDRLDKRRQRTGLEGPRSDLRIYVLKRGTLWTAKIVYMAVCVGVIIPTLLALVFDCYVLLPLRFTLNPTLVPRVRIVDAWALGLLYMKALSFGLRAGPRNSLSRGIQQMISGGMTHPDPVSATKQVIAPWSAVSFSLSSFLRRFSRRACYCSPGGALPGKVLFTRFYPGILSFALSSLIFEGMHETLHKWQQDIRDTEFLVEMRLRNHETGTIKHDLRSRAAPASGCIVLARHDGFSVRLRVDADPKHAPNERAVVVVSVLVQRLLVHVVAQVSIALGVAEEDATPGVLVGAVLRCTGEWRRSVLGAREGLSDVLDDEDGYRLAGDDGAAAGAGLVAAEHVVGIFWVEAVLIRRGRAAKPALQAVEAENVAARRESARRRERGET